MSAVIDEDRIRAIIDWETRHLRARLRRLEPCPANTLNGYQYHHVYEEQGGTLRCKGCGVEPPRAARKPVVGPEDVPPKPMPSEQVPDEGRDIAVERLLYAIDVEGLAHKQARGARGALWDALQALRPDIVATMTNGLDDAGQARRRFFPEDCG